jgi:protein phosphatase
VLVRTHAERLEPGDRVLLCSDGLYGPVDDSAISHILEDSADLQQAVEALLDRANRNGGPDNVTAILLHYTDEGNG